MSYPKESHPRKELSIARISDAANLPMEVAIRSRRSELTLSTMTSEGSFRPLFLSGAIMIRNMRRPVRCVVSGQTVTDAWDSR